MSPKGLELSLKPNIRHDFPIFSKEGDYASLVYLDSAASSQKPAVVIQALTDFYQNSYANIRRGLYDLSLKATEKLEKTRARLGSFVGAKDEYVTVFVRGATEALNLLAHTYGGSKIGPGDEILITEMEHHANLLPWQYVAETRGAVLKIARIDSTQRLDLQHFMDQISPKTRLAAFTHVSNVLGTINPVQHMVDQLRERGIPTIIDGCQAAPCMPLDLAQLGCSAYTFSAHKMLGPTGVGALFLRKEFAQDLPPYHRGGGMLMMADYQHARYLPPPQRFEAGTPALAEITAFHHALDYLDDLGLNAILQHEQDLADQLIGKLKAMDGVRIFGPPKAQDRIGVVSFALNDVHPHDAGMFLSQQGICVRVGHHCAQPLMRKLDAVATIRASAYVYNDAAEIDQLVEALENCREYFRMRSAGPEGV